MDSKQIKEKIKEGYIRTSVVFEVIGRPAEHIIEALKKLIEFIQQDKKIIIISHKIHDAEEVKEENMREMFSSFMELELLLDSPKKAIEFIYDYMPASMEIIEPSNFSFKLNEFNSVLNDITGRLHQYDAMLKQTNLEKQIIFNKLQEVQKFLKEKGFVKESSKKPENKEEKK